jgi:hypothetical protein
MEEGTDPITASESQTVFLVKGKEEDDYIDALRNGRVYCYRNHYTKWVRIKDYSVIAGSQWAISGEVLPYTEDARLVFDVELMGPPRTLTLTVVKDGKIFFEKDFSASERLVVPLPAPEENTGYVRVVIAQDKGMRVVTNPIFFMKNMSKTK